MGVSRPHDAASEVTVTRRVAIGSPNSFDRFRLYALPAPIVPLTLRPADEPKPTLA